jgi:uncharacterized protein (TIGR02996 family)
MAPYHHPDWEALLRAVATAYADDLPRLVAADWLDEHDEADRAELIRVQCEMAQTPNTNRQRLSELIWREQALLHSPTGGLLWAWEACPNIVRFNFNGEGTSFHGLGLDGAERVRFVRGFPDSITCPAADWLVHGKLVVPRQPIQEVTLQRAADVPLEQWWNMLETLRLLRRVRVATRQERLIDWLRNRCPDAEVRMA